jgi:hypothetical protein
VFCSSHSIANLPVYQCAKFEALNPRINKIRSHESWLWSLPQVQTHRFSIPTIILLSNLVTMSPRALGNVIDSSLQVFSHVYASQLPVTDQGQAKIETQNGKCHCRICFIDLAFSTIFSMAVGRFLANSQLCILSCSCHRDYLLIISCVGRAGRPQSSCHENTSKTGRPRQAISQSGLMIKE